MMSNKIDFKVCVRCFTFNQSHYITDAMNGFCMQETEFPFVCCIVDDASTDGEQNVIRNYVDEHFNVADTAVTYKKETDYAHIIFTQHKENKNCYFAVLLLKENHYSNKALKGKKMSYLSEWRDTCDYEALCEGDDYWIDPLKLQKQYDYMEVHSECGVVGSAKKIYDQSISEFKQDIDSEDETDFQKILILGRFNCGTCTVMYRQQALDGYREFVKGQNWKLGDLPMWLYITHKYKAFRFCEPFAVYRVLPQSASHFESYKHALAFSQSVSDVRLFFAEKLAPELLPLVKKESQKRFLYNAVNYNKLSDALSYFDIKTATLKDCMRILRIVPICILRSLIKKQ